MKTVITNEIADYINKNYLLLPSRQLAEKLNISKTPVLRYLKLNNLTVPLAIQKEWKRRASIAKPYNKKELDFIVENISSMTIKDIAKKFKRCNNKILVEIKALGLQHIVDAKKKASYFQKGIVPANKGKKLEDFMKPETIAKFKANQYKKKHIPHNAKQNFTEVKRIDTSGKIYTLIKVPGERKLMLKNRFVWQEENGVIPAGHNIIFKDGDTENFDLTN